MAKRYTSNKTLYTVDSTLKKLKTVWDDKLLLMTRGGVSANVRERVMTLNYGVLRNISERLSIVNMIINCREMQLMPFFEPARLFGDKGFAISKKGKYDKRFKGKDKKADQMVEMVQQTGFVYDPLREDDFTDFAKMLVREILTIDQVAIELQYNKKKEIAAFWLVDGATISRATAEGYDNKPDLCFVQEVDGQVTAAYTREELVFDYMFKRASMGHRGYGYSLLEQGVDLVTTLILGISHNRDLFTKDKIPKGFIALQGEADQEVISALERYWYMAMSGAGAKFRIPILPTGKEGVSMDFKMLGQSNRDIEYNKLMLFFLSLFAGVYGMDMAELGIKTEHYQTVLSEGKIEGRQEYSKSRGVPALLNFLATVMNKIIRKIDQDYEFRFVGVDLEDETKKYERATKATAATRTINEMREEDGLETLEGEEYDKVATANLNQLRQFLQQAQMGEGMEGEEEYEEGEEYEEENPEIADEDEESRAEVEETPTTSKVQKSEDLEKHLEQLLKTGYDVEVLP